MPVVSIEEFIDSHRHSVFLDNEPVRRAALIIAQEFAEAHRQECLNQAAGKARTQHVVTRGADYYIVNKDSILNAYSKKNIK